MKKRKNKAIDLYYETEALKLELDYQLGALFLEKERNNTSEVYLIKLRLKEIHKELKLGDEKK